MLDLASFHLPNWDRARLAAGFLTGARAVVGLGLRPARALVSLHGSWRQVGVPAWPSAGVATRWASPSQEAQQSCTPGSMRSGGDTESAHTSF